MKKSKADFSEADIEKTIRYLRVKDPSKATREYAIKLLKGMKISAHVIAHKILDKTEK